MPRTKARKSSKKKTKKQQRKRDGHMALIRASLNHHPKKAALNSQDSLELALGWIDGGKVDAKRLVKTLPNTARDLRDGACNADDLAELLTEMSLSSEYLRPSSSLDRDSTDTHPRAEHFIAVLVRTIPHLEADRELFLQFRLAFQDHLAQRVSFLKGNNEALVICTIKAAFDETCAKLEDKVAERLYDGDVGAFRRACPTFGAPVAEFERIIEKSGRGFNLLRNELYAAASSVSFGLDQIKETCWECNDVFADLKQCRGCATALYCCHSCQKSAWKAGHNKKCFLLATHNANLKASLAVVDSAHSKGVIDGLYLQHNLDCCIALGCSRWHHTQNKLRLFEGNDMLGPSITVFYENLGRIACGEWWIYSDTVSLEQYNSSLSQGGHNDTDRFRILSFLLCFDCFDSMADVVITDPAAIAAKFFHTSFDATSWKDFSEKMPAARYLQLYQTFDKSENGTKRRTYRRYGKCVAQRELREKFHK